MNRLALEHAKRNQLTQDSWDTFATHRQRVTDLILCGDDCFPILTQESEESLSGAANLCVLGAGNSNDLDLLRLATHFDEIHLVDLDVAALAQGVSRQVKDPVAKNNIRQFSSIDLTGLYERLADWTPDSPPPEDEIQRVIELARSAPIAAFGESSSGSYKVVASVCLLTQLIDSLRLVLPKTAPHFNELVLAVRDRHLRLLADLMGPGATGVLITDFVSSDTCPELVRLANDDEIAQQAGKWIAAGNFFTGVNPAAVQARFREDETLRTKIRDTAIAKPWRWSMGMRSYAVYALLMR